MSGAGGAAGDRPEDRVPLVAPVAELAWQAVVDIAPAEPLGDAPGGERFIVPILGGRFEGAVDGATLRGHVLPGGADRQLLRPDGVKELDALYEMRTDDGIVLTVRNRVLIDAPPGGARYAVSQLRVIAPAGRLAMLNRRVFVGTLATLRPERQAVLVRAWLMRG